MSMIFVCIPKGGASGVRGDEKVSNVPPQQAKKKKHHRTRVQASILHVL